MPAQLPDPMAQFSNSNSNSNNNNNDNINNNNFNNAQQQSTNISNMSPGAGINMMAAGGGGGVGGFRGAVNAVSAANAFQGGGGGGGGVSSDPFSSQNMAQHQPRPNQNSANPFGGSPATGGGGFGVAQQGGGGFGVAQQGGADPFGSLGGI